jgi:hypothetical protein
MTLHARLRRLEKRSKEPVEMTFYEQAAIWEKCHFWMQEHDFADALAALESGVPIPPNLRKELETQAVWCPKHRAWAKIEASLLGDTSIVVTDQDERDFYSVPDVVA